MAARPSESEREKTLLVVLIRGKFRVLTVISAKPFWSSIEFRFDHAGGCAISRFNGLFAEFHRDSYNAFRKHRSDKTQTKPRGPAGNSGWDVIFPMHFIAWSQRQTR